MNGSLKRDFSFLEKYNFQIRLDAINLLNRSHFDVPNVTPTSTNFGKVTAAAEVVNRFIQLQARIRFRMKADRGPANDEMEATNEETTFSLGRRLWLDSPPRNSRPVLRQAPGEDAAVVEAGPESRAGCNHWTAGRSATRRPMKITDIKTFLVGAGGRNWVYVKILTDQGIVRDRRGLFGRPG